MSYRATNQAEAQETRIQDGRGEQLLTSPAAFSLYASMNVCQSPEQLDAVARLIWQCYSAGALDDETASYLVTCIERQRPLSRRTSMGEFAKIDKVNGRISRFLPPTGPVC